MSSVKKNACISFPKSGRTWLRVMLDDLGVSLEYTHAGSGHARPKPIEQITTATADDYERVVFLHRDPRDTAVSGYYQKAKRRDGYDGDISSFLRDPLHGVEKICRFNRLWLEHASQDANILAVSYEDLHANTFHVLEAILRFLGEDRDPDEVAEVMTANTFDKMRDREASGAYVAKYGKALRPTDPDDPNSFKVRKGKVGGYRDELSAEDIVYCDAVIGRFGKGGVQSTT